MRIYIVKDQRAGVLIARAEAHRQLRAHRQEIDGQIIALRALTPAVQAAAMQGYPGAEEDLMNMTARIMELERYRNARD
jgi:hypothetical protein